MTFFKALQHDMRCGLLRPRYLSIPLIALFPLLDFFFAAHSLSASLGEELLYLFKGSVPLKASRIQLPLYWLLFFDGCLLLNLDYILGDLSKSGLQLVVRCRRRSTWLLSKFVWNLASTVLYFLTTLAFALVTSLVAGTELSLNVRMENIEALLEGLSISATPTVEQTLLVGILLPFLTAAALNLLEMTLCLFAAPTVSFLCCEAILLLSVYFGHWAMLGNGAMTVRTLSLLSQSTPSYMVAVCVSGMALCILLGIVRFSRMDILPKED